MVCVCTEEKKDNYKYYDGGRFLIDPNIAIETLDDLQSRGCHYPSDVKLNDLLILHPYDQNKYIHIEDVESAMVKQTKFLRYSEILQDLGATSYKVTSVITNVYEAKTDVHGKVSFEKIKTPVDLDVNVNKQEDFKSKLGFELSDTFKGVCSISEQSFEHVNDLVKQYRLQDDEYIKTLINKRRPGKENYQLTEHLHCETMHEFNKCLDVAVSFNVATFLDLSTNIKHAISQKVEYILDIDVSFPEQ